MTLFYAYFSFSEYITNWYNMTKPRESLLETLMDMSQFGWLVIFHIVFAMIVPVIVIGIPWFRSVRSVTLVSALIVVALWIKRYLIVVPTLETPYIPIQDVRTEYVVYSASWVEIALTVAGVALMLLIFTIASKIAPIIPVAEVEDKHDEAKLKLIFKIKGA